jgi:hypothetical protein
MQYISGFAKLSPDNNKDLSTDSSSGDTEHRGDIFGILLEDIGNIIKARLYRMQVLKSS